VSAGQVGGGLSGVVGIALGDFHSCALLVDGSAKCWGSNNSSQLGNGTYESTMNPVDVNAVFGAAAITAGDAFGCVLLPAGTVQCWQ